MGLCLTQAFIFDFDGTLVNSEQAIYECFQAITKKLAPERIEYARNTLIGPPLHDTASEILGKDYQNKIEEFKKLFIEMHDNQIIFHVQPYPFVSEVLRELYDQNIPMAIATNKRKAPTIKLINHFGWNNYFKIIQCSNGPKKNKSKYEMIQDILDKFSEFNQSCLVGDTVNDGLAANNHNIPFVKASYGYGKNQDWSKIKKIKTINSFNQIKSLIG